MLQISKRGEQMPASPIRRLVPFAEKAKKERGLYVYHLNIGQPDLPTPPEFWQAIRNANIAVLEYSHSAGLESYRRKVVQYYARFGAQLEYTDILITCGGSEAIRFALGACLDPGDEIIVPEPFYANYLGFAIESGIVLRPITTYIEQNFAIGSIEAFEQLITPRTKAILICNPSNPTGKLYSQEEIEALAQIALKHDLYLIADEVYKEFCYDGLVFTSVLSLPQLSEHAIVIDSVSKRYSACGARIGCLISKNKRIIETALKFAQARLSPPTLGQIGAQALVDLPDSYYADIVQEYAARRNVVLEELEKMPGVICPKVSGAFYVMPQLPIHDSDDFCRYLLETFSYEGQTVMLAPATGFYATPGLGKNQVRISYVLEIPKLKKAMQILAQGLQTYLMEKSHAAAVS
ncbi:MAG: pyridoxal phosphate-dependent aminotransferase [Bacteroidia bacterium]|nr:pyridoxal phosphate-dependent aminotransferase [Bacteroidia bacterium]MDW8158959.1 pyridoxal phosphate-dependent aminotransferase [Bacteroidia bacterium]